MFTPSRRTLRTIALPLLPLFAATVNSPAATLGATAQTVFPATTHQVFSMNYQRLANDPQAQQVENQVLPEQMKALGPVLQTGGITPSQLNRLTFANYTDKTKSDMIGVAEGDFSHFNTAKFFTKTARQPAPPQIQGVSVYTSGDLTFFLPDQNSLVFGSHEAIVTAINAQTGATPRISQSDEVSDLVSGTESTDVWSVLDSDGSRAMVHGLLGTMPNIPGMDASSLDKHFSGARYNIDFSSDVQVNLQLITSDAMSASVVYVGLQAALAARQNQEASPAAKAMLKSVNVDASGRDVFLQFTIPESQIPSLLQTDLLRSITH